MRFRMICIFIHWYPSQMQNKKYNVLIFILQVLDLGFNLIRILPTNAFYRVNELTLLALDGNPMATLPEDAFKHLNSSLRGLSLGGRFLTCDCKVSKRLKTFALEFNDI